MHLAARAVVIAALVGGCAHDVRARFPAAPDAPTGTLILLLSQPASAVTVAVNGVLVAEDEHTKRITIDGIPTGTAEIAITANGGDKQLRTWIATEHPTTIPLGVPESDTGLLRSVIGALISVVAYSLLH
jgi:hypothetical protein